MSDHIVSLASGAFFAAHTDEDLLSAAQRAHWLVRYGCRNGNCEACAATLLEGSVTQAGIAIDATQAPQKILLCLCRAAGDLQIELPGNPQHGSSEQAKRYYARFNGASCRYGAGSELDERSVTQLHITLPAGRRVPFHAGQYVSIEYDGKLIRAEIDTLASSGRELHLACAAAPTLPPDSYVSLLCPLGYCYNAAATDSILILYDAEQHLQATLLKRALPTAVMANGEQLDRMATATQFDTVLACTRDPQLAAAWYDRLLNRRIAFNEFRSDIAIGYRWNVCRQDDNGNCFVVHTALSEQAARTAVAEFEQRGHKQLYWAEPMNLAATAQSQ
ncbi:MAG TPA: 2Fe-2S iron-sulfur cluster-binding protein [Spongiibacteraceae bacterium]|nr:2Fe-2S iron-sulfur cluster-binding protein [Spongiibacteraceae bacterium]